MFGRYKVFTYFPKKMPGMEYMKITDTAAPTIETSRLFSVSVLSTVYPSYFDVCVCACVCDHFLTSPLICVSHRYCLSR